VVEEGLDNIPRNLVNSILPLKGGKEAEEQGRGLRKPYRKELEEGVMKEEA
jgi:hypothetical protein